MNLQPVGSNHRGEIRYDCPLCSSQGKSPDTKGHLYVNYRKGVFLCHRCNCKGTTNTLNWLCSQVEISLEVPLRSHGSVWYGEREHDDLVVPDTDPIRPDSMSFAYLSGRGFNMDDVTFYGLRSGMYDENNGVYLKGRIYIPVVRCQETVYWTSRSYTGQSLRYKSASVPKVSVFNYDGVSPYDTVVITEGPFSAMAVGRNAVALLGKYPTPCQIDDLVSMNKERYVVMLDGDAIRQSLELAHVLRRSGKTVSMVQLPYGKDPADMKDRLQDLLCNPTVFSFKEEVRLRIGV